MKKLLFIEVNEVNYILEIYFKNNGSQKILPIDPQSVRWVGRFPQHETFTWRRTMN